jgi:3-oxoisoapionate kinase
VVGSSGAEYALTQWWRESEGADRSEQDYDRFRAVDQVLAISGSASKLSAQQIDAAVAVGFAEIAVDASEVVDDTRWPRVADETVAKAATLLQDGRSVILHTARGPDDPRISKMIDSLEAQGHTRAQAKHEGGRTLGMRLGHIAREILRAVPLQRLLLSGGDTSSQVTKVLAPDALVIAARLARGAPLCRFVSSHPRLNDLEVALKGGQMGEVDFFEKARRGSG